MADKPVSYWRDCTVFSGVWLKGEVLMKSLENGELRAMSLALSPLGLAVWYLLAGAQDLMIRSMNPLPAAFENQLLILAGSLSLIAAGILAASAVREAVYSLLLIVLLLFGTKKLRNAGGDLGGAIRNFKRAMGGDKGPEEDDKEQLDKVANVIEGEATRESERDRA